MPAGQQINFPAAGPRGVRLAHNNLLKPGANLTNLIVETLAMGKFDQEISSRLQMCRHKFQCQLGQVHCFRLVRYRHTTHIGGHVRQHKINLPGANSFRQLRQGLILGKIAFNEVDAIDRHDRQDIEANHAAR